MYAQTWERPKSLKDFKGKGSTPRKRNSRKESSKSVKTVKEKLRIKKRTKAKGDQIKRMKKKNCPLATDRTEAFTHWGKSKKKKKGEKYSTKYKAGKFRETDSDCEGRSSQEIIPFCEKKHKDHHRDQNKKRKNPTQGNESQPKKRSRCTSCRAEGTGKSAYKT